MRQYCKECKERQDIIDRQAEQIMTKNAALQDIYVNVRRAVTPTAATETLRASNGLRNEPNRGSK